MQKGHMVMLGAVLVALYWLFTRQGEDSSIKAQGNRTAGVKVSHAALPQVENTADDETDQSKSFEDLWSDAMNAPQDRDLILKFFNKVGTLQESVIERDIAGIIQHDFSGDLARFEAHLHGKGLTLDAFKNQRRDHYIVVLVRQFVEKGAISPQEKAAAYLDWIRKQRAKAEPSPTGELDD